MRFPSLIALALLALIAPSSPFPAAPAVARARPAVVCGADSYINSSGHCVHRPVAAPSPPPGPARAAGTGPTASANTVEERAAITAALLNGSDAPASA